MSNLAPHLLNIRIKAIDIGNARAADLPKTAPAQVRCVFRRNYGSLTIDGPLSETSRWRAIARVLRSPLDATGSSLLPAFFTLCGSPLPQICSVPIYDGCWTGNPVHHGCRDSLDQPLIKGIATTQTCRACQAGPSPRQRRQNVRGAFKVSNPSAVKVYVATLASTRPLRQQRADPFLRIGAHHPAPSRQASSHACIRHHPPTNFHKEGKRCRWEKP